MKIVLDPSLARGMARIVHDGEVVCTMYHLDARPPGGTTLDRIRQAMETNRKLGRPPGDSLALPPEES